MSQDFVTQDEFHSVLNQFAKITALEDRFRDFDTVVRAYVDRVVASEGGSIRSKVISDLSAVKGEVSQSVSSQMTAVKEAVNSEFTAKLSTFTQEVKTDAIKHSSEALEKKANELRGEFHSADTKLKSDVESKLTSHKSDLSTAVSDGLEKAVSKAALASSSETKALLQSFQSQSQQSVENAIKQISEVVEKSLKSFHEVLSKELASKVIDKQKIEARMESIQSEIHAKAQSVIEFQLEQARLMMEQTARAEVKDGIQSALSLLTR